MKKYFIFIIVILYAKISFANPNITDVSGIIQHGNYITVYGSNFGEKTPAKPQIWCDFEDGTIDCSKTLSAGTPFRGGSHSNWTTDNPHSRSKRNIYTIPNTNNVKTASSFGIDANGATRFFGFARRKYPAKWWNYVVNHKTFYAHSTDMVKGQEIGYTWQYHNFANSPNGPGQINFRADPGVPSIDYGFSNGKQMPNDGTWFIEEYEMKRSSAVNLQDGQVKYWVNGSKYKTESVLDMTPDYPEKGYGQIILDEYWQQFDDNGVVKGWPINNGKVQYDDIYMDTTWSRVMIGNASTYDGCTHREPLIPVEWSTTSIRAYFNQGSFSNQENVYLFVVDSNGLTSNGYGIKIGGEYERVGSSLVPPSAPINLIINK